MTTVLERIVIWLTPSRKFELRMRCGYSSGRWRSHDVVVCPFCSSLVKIYYNNSTVEKCEGCGAVHDWKKGTAKAI